MSSEISRDFIAGGAAFQPVIEDDWALYLDENRDDPVTLQAGASAIMKEMFGITSLDGRIFSGREHKGLDPREYYRKAMETVRSGSLASLWSDEYVEFMEAKQRGDRAAMRSMAAKKIKGEGVGHDVGEWVDKHWQEYQSPDVYRGLNSIRDAMSPEELAILDAPREIDPEWAKYQEEDEGRWSPYDDNPHLMYIPPDRAREAAERRQAELDRERFHRHYELFQKHHDAIEGERRLDSYERQLEDENLWAVIESLKGHISDGAQRVVDMALQSTSDPTNSAVMRAFEELSTPEQRSIAGILQALHYSRGDGFGTLARDAGNAFMDTLESVTVGAVRGATDLVRRTWMDSDEYRDMVERRVLLEDANRERMTEWGYMGNTVIGVASTIPYMAAAAIPYVGVADIMLSARDEFQSEAMRNGVDVASPDFIIGSAAFAMAYAYVEKMEVETLFGGLKNFSKRQMYCDMFHNIRAALGVAGAFAGNVLTESGQEGLQRAIEVTAENWGGATLKDVLAGFTDDFVQSLGTMAVLGTFGAAKQRIAYRHGAFAYDRAEAIAAQSRSVELEQRVLGNPGEVGPLSSYGRTYGRMVEHWLNAGTDADARQATLMRWGLDTEQATAIHGSLYRVWQAIEGADTPAATKAAQKSALVGGGRVLTPAEVIAQIQNGSYLGKVEDLGNGKQAVNLSIAGKTLRMVVEPKREASAIDYNDEAMFESIVNALNGMDTTDGERYTVEGWKQLKPEERETIVEAQQKKLEGILVPQGHVEFFDGGGNKVSSMDGRVLDAITGRVQLTDSALPQTAFHETMHGVLTILSNLAMGEKDENGGWKVEPDKDAAQLVQALSKAFPNAKGEALGAPQTAREAVNEELFADSFQSYLTGKIDVVEHNGLFDRIGRFLANLFGFGGKTHEFAKPRTDQQRLFNTAITGHIAQALEAAEETKRDQAPAERDQAPAERDQAPAERDQAPAERDQAPAPEAPSETESILRGIEEAHQDLAETVAMFRNRDPLTRVQMASLHQTGDGQFSTRLVWENGYRWNEMQVQWEYNEKLDGPMDDADLPQGEYMGADGQMHGEPNGGLRHSIAGIGTPNGIFTTRIDTQNKKTVDGKNTVIFRRDPRESTVLLSQAPTIDATGAQLPILPSGAEIGGQYTADDRKALRAWVTQTVAPMRGIVATGEFGDVHIGGAFVNEILQHGIGRKADMEALTKAKEILETLVHFAASPNEETRKKARKPQFFEYGLARISLSDGDYLVLGEIGISTGGNKYYDQRIAGKIASAETNAEGDLNTGPGQSAKLPALDGPIDNRYSLLLQAQSDFESQTQTGTPRASVSPSRPPSPDFAMDGTVVDALPAHLRADARAIVAERANTPRWMTDPDGTPTELNERDWLRREAEKRHGAGRRFAVSGRAPTAAEMEEAQRQYDAVVARFTNPDGTKKAGWMKAPNGQPTRLTERQWVQVRKENFKRWFGDWEAADLQRFLEGQAVGIATGTEFADDTREAVALEMKRFFDSLGGVATSPYLGDVQLTHNGINDTMRKGMGRTKYAAFKLVPNIIEKGRVVQTDENWKGRNYGTAVVAAPISIGNIPHVAVVVVRRYQNGDQNFYLHEVSPLSVQKNGIAGLRSSLAEGGEGGSSRDFGNILTHPLFSVNPDSVSKIVDENGEPLVVWHGSRWNPLAEEPGKAVFHHGAVKNTSEGVGFYFTPSRDLAEGFGEAGGYFLNIRNAADAYSSLELLSEDEIDDIIEDENLDREDGSIEAALDNARRTKLRGKLRQVIGILQNKGYKFHKQIDSELLDALSPNTVEGVLDYLMDAESFVDGDMDKEQFANDLRAAEAEVFGIDGYHSRGYSGGTGAFVAFSPSQIKSATDNIGTFDSTNPDIRYAIAGTSGAARMGIRTNADAEAMERSGATREEIWRETGWWRGRDGKWRVEIPDFTLSMGTLDRDAYDRDPEFFVRKRKLSDLISDTTLFDAYPQLRRITVQTPHSDTFGGLDTFGDYNGGTRIRLNMSALKFDPAETHSTLAHEIQHAIQKMENFAQGGNPGQFKPVDVAQMRRKAKAERKRGNEAEASRLEEEADELEENALDGMVVVDQTGYMDGFEAYRSLGGEVEARNVEARLKMTPEERAATPPWKTEDVPEERQIARFSIHSTLSTGRESTATYIDSQGVKRTLFVERGTRKHGMFKVAYKHCVDYGTAWTGGFTLEELERYEQTILKEGKRTFNKATGSLTFKWKSPEGVTFTIGAYTKGKGKKSQQVVNTVYTDRGQSQTKMLGTHFKGRTPIGQPSVRKLPRPGAEVKPENGGGRGSVAGSDPGWFDVVGQADAAEREAREGARHGMAFGGARFSNRSWVEAFAARDKALKIERTDEDYNRLIDALGLKGKMTAAEAREAADALQTEVKGGADVISDLVKAAEKKNFRRTVENIVTAAHSYGMEVGANSRQAWEKYVSEARRNAKGRDAADFTNDTGWDLAELLWAARDEGFELPRKEKPVAEPASGDQGGGATDEERELEAALIDGKEGDLGYSAAEAREKLRAMLEERMGDVEERRGRMKAALDAWRKDEAARIEKLRAEREAREAAKARDAADAKAGMDDPVDGESKGKGERPGEVDENEAVEEMPDFKAFCERLKAEGLDLSNPGEVAYVMRWYVEDWMAKKSGTAPGEVLKDPVAAAQYRRTVIQLLRDACNKLLDPNDGVASKTVERMLGEIPGDASANEIQSRSRSIIGFLKRNAIRQSRKQLVNGIQDDIKKQGIRGKKFDETEKDLGRKITGEREAYCRYLKRILNWGSQRIAAEQQRLNDIITGRMDAYKAARGEDAALDALAITDREIHRATERLNALQLWGGLRAKSPGEIARAGQQIHDWLEKERDEHEKRWADWMSSNDELAARLATAVSASMGDYTPDDPGFVGQLSDALTTNFRARLERLAVGSGAEGRRIIDEVMMLVYAGSERLGVLKAQRRERTDAMLARCVEGTGQTVGEFLKSLNENIPEELNRTLATEEQPTRMAWGQALQLLGSLEQTASYQRNIDANGRGTVGLDGEEQTPHRDLILAALADKPQMLRLVEEMRKIYDADREDISREFYAVTGNAVLTPDPLYLPARMFNGAGDNLETTVRAWNPFGPAFTPRIANKRDFNLSASIMDVYNERMKETATALAFGMRGMELRSILARKSVQEAIAKTHGKFALRKMIAHLTDIVSDGYKGDGGQLEGYRKAIRAVGDLTTYSALSWNVVTMLKQMTSIPAWTALLDGGYGEIFRHIVHFDREAARELMAAPGFTARYGADSFAKMFKQEMDNPQGGNLLSRLYKAGMTAVQMGDFVPGILVGTGVYKARKLALMRKGLAEGAAREQAARETWGLIEENQQSSRLENTPEILRRGGFIGRQLSKFASSPMMQVGHEIHTLRMWLAEAKLEALHGGKESGAVKAMLNAKGDDAVRWRKRFVNQFVCNHVLMPAAMYAISTLFKVALGGEPPDKEEIWGDLLMQMVAGPFSRIFLIGALADATGEWAARLLGGKPNVYSRGDLAATQHLHKAMGNAGRLLYDAMDMDWASCRDDFVKMVSSYNAPFRYAATITQNATGYDPAQARRARKRELARREAAE